ncbi:MAG: hypothetical protein HYX90_10520 [Chloroflexi bacterium]|nr:hypothetical protein [Chloroflexota bacterium]
MKRLEEQLLNSETAMAKVRQDNAKNVAEVTRLYHELQKASPAIVLRDCIIKGG